MKIGIDVRFWDQTGIGRYTRNLLLEISKLDKKNSYYLFTRSEDEQAVKSVLTNSNFNIIPVSIRWHSIEEQLKFPKILNKYLLDLVHFPYFSLPIFYKGNYIVTIHDLIIHHFQTGRASTHPFPIYYGKRFFYKKIIQKAAKDSKAIIAVSNATASEIIDHLGIEKKKIFVTHEAVDENFKDLSTQHREKFPYILYVGNAYPHKNTESFIMLMNHLRNSFPDLKLLMVGKEDFFYSRLDLEIKKNNLEGRIIRKEEVSDSDLSSLYANAQALIFPSLMEGFGLPILEAMSKKCIVVCSDIPSFREIASDAAIFINPINAIEMVKKVEEVLNFSASQKQKYIDAGLKNVEKYSWTKTARETLRVYETFSNIIK
ncbi:MAG: glycosyltransferase family 4 protein [Candidatus Levybacteria bacterium]|nr:glycosyltransferase family 4 protein [Candidatus Levybacteria bacterium]